MLLELRRLGVLLIEFLQAAFDFLARFGASVAVFFLQCAEELSAPAPDALNVAVGEFALSLLRACAHLFRASFQNVVTQLANPPGSRIGLNSNPT
jgi:hypothetical protein